MQALNFSQIQTLAFTGGGNRCWWQAGLLTQMQACGAHLPATLVGTSAGAAIAASFLAGSTHTALEACQRLYEANARLFKWRGLSRLQLNFAHQTVYPAWLAQYWQPSRKVPVSTWDCRPGTTVEDAFTLGQDDARRALADGQIQLSI